MNFKKLFSAVALLIITSVFFVLKGQGLGEGNANIRLLIRGDDIGSFHAANLACIRSYQDGIMQTVEIMVPCPWYPEAVRLINENPGLDVGIHLVLTSEWESMKWRPLTGISSITDERGYFYPMVWPNENFPKGSSLRESAWKLEDIDKELRAQIELAKSEMPGVSHISSHMGFQSADPAIDSLVKALAIEYDLNIEPEVYGVKRFSFERDRLGVIEDWEHAFIEALDELSPGAYLFVEHPSLDIPEMETVGHVGYTEVGVNRQLVTDLFTSEKVIKALLKRNIELISYSDLQK